MFRLFIIMTLTVASLGVTSTVSAENTVFKSRDALGNTVFSDQASEAAEEIVIESPQTFKTQPTSRLFTRTKPETIFLYVPVSLWFFPKARPLRRGHAHEVIWNQREGYLPQCDS